MSFNLCIFAAAVHSNQIPKHKEQAQNFFCLKQIDYYQITLKQQYQKSKT